MVIADVVYIVDDCIIQTDWNSNLCGKLFSSTFQIPISTVFQTDLLPTSVRHRHLRIRQCDTPDLRAAALPNLATRVQPQHPPPSIVRNQAAKGTPAPTKPTLTQTTHPQPGFFFPPEDGRVKQEGTEESEYTSDGIPILIPTPPVPIPSYDLNLVDITQHEHAHTAHGDQTLLAIDSAACVVDVRFTEEVAVCDDTAAYQEYQEYQENEPNVTETVGEEEDGDDGEDDVCDIVQHRIVVSIPIVSVILTTYNCGKYLEFAVRSLQLQTLTNWELIIINDKSTDHSDSIIRTLAQSDDRIIYLHNIHNIGCYASKNIAMQYARGTWLTFHDADDCSMCERLEKQLHFCVHGNDVTDGNEVATTGKQSQRTPAAVGYDCCYVTSLSRKDKVWAWVPITMFIRTEVFRSKLGVFDTVRFGADSEIRNRMDMVGIRVGVIGDYLYACPDRWIEIQSRENSLTGNTKHDPVRMKYKTAFMQYHEAVKNTNSAHHLFYTIPTPSSTRPFSIQLEPDEATLLYPSSSDIQSCIQFNQQCE